MTDDMIESQTSMETITQTVTNNYIAYVYSLKNLYQLKYKKDVDWVLYICEVASLSYNVGKKGPNQDLHDSSINSGSARLSLTSSCISLLRVH